MAKTLVDQRTDVQRKAGHYRAFDGQGTVIWEQDPFVVGVDKIPGGLSEAMHACTITGPDGKLTHRWDPWKMFSHDDRVTVVG